MRGPGYAGGFDAHAHAGLAEWEVGLVGLSNCAAAAVILTEWRFPTATINGIRDHYLLTPVGSTLAHVINLAASAADRGGHALPGETRYWDVAPEKLAAAGVESAHIDEAMRRALELFGPLRAAVS